jgi:hypothetical protein
MPQTEQVRFMGYFLLFASLCNFGYFLLNVRFYGGAFHPITMWVLVLFWPATASAFLVMGAAIVLIFRDPTRTLPYVLAAMNFPLILIAIPTILSGKA